MSRKTPAIGDILMYREGRMWLTVKLILLSVIGKRRFWTFETAEIVDDGGYPSLCQAGEAFEVSDTVDGPSYVWTVRDPKTPHQVY